MKRRNTKHALYSKSHAFPMPAENGNANLETKTKRRFTLTSYSLSVVVTSHLHGLLLSTVPNDQCR